MLAFSLYRTPAARSGRPQIESKSVSICVHLWLNRAFQGRPVAKLTGLPQTAIAPDRQAWLAKLADLRARLATGKIGLTVGQILDEDRGQ